MEKHLQNANISLLKQLQHCFDKKTIEKQKSFVRNLLELQVYISSNGTKPDMQMLAGQGSSFRCQESKLGA